MVNRCFMCTRHGEAAYHLLLTLWVAHELWSLTLNLFRMQCRRPHREIDLVIMIWLRRGEGEE